MRRLLCWLFGWHGHNANGTHRLHFCHHCGRLLRPMATVKIEGRECWEPKPNFWMDAEFWTAQEADYLAATGKYTPEMERKLYLSITAKAAEWRART